MEHPVRFTRTDKIVSTFILVTQNVEIEVHAEIFLCVLTSELNVRKSAQPQKVHFEHSERFDLYHVELSGYIFAVSLERNVVHNRFFADNNACGVHTGVSGKPLHLYRHVDYFMQFFVRIVNIYQIRNADVCTVFKEFHSKRLFYGRLAVHKFGDFIYAGIRNFIHARNVFYRRLGRKGTESDYLRNSVRTVFSSDIFHDFAATRIRNIHVEVRHGYPFPVKETLENQVISQRLDVRYSDRICDYTRNAGASARTDRNTHASRIVYKVPYNKVIIAKAHGTYHVELVIEAIAYFFGDNGVTFFKPVFRKV